MSALSPSHSPRFCGTRRSGCITGNPEVTGNCFEISVLPTNRTLLNENAFVVTNRPLVRKSSHTGKKRKYGSDFDAEMRLLYVALTRARMAVELPQGILARHGLRTTTGDVVGKPAVALPAQESFSVAERDEISAVVSPYHSRQKKESREIAAVRRFFS